MKIVIAGLWHLGLVTAACLAKAGHHIIAYDPDKNVIHHLQNDMTPIFEPGLNELLLTVKNHIQYTSDPQDISESHLIWITFDTPVDDQDQADVLFIHRQMEILSPFISSNTLLLISSQVPLGTTRKIQQFFWEQYPDKEIRCGYIPENLRLGKAIQVFTQPDRFVVGLDHPNDQLLIKELLGAYTNHFIFMSIASAEMTKHALNAFLALSVTFINEIATLCETTGANATDVEMGLKSEERIGPKAYLKPGGAIAGGTLLRDIHYLNSIAKNQHQSVPLLSAVSESNTYHKHWAHRKILEVMQELKNKTVAILGLTYKANTNTLRRSSSIETCEWLHEQGIQIQAFDPAIESLPSTLHFIQLKHSMQEALHKADAVIIATEWPDFRNLNAETIMENVTQPWVLDANGFLTKTLGQDTRIRYCSVGRLS